MFGTSKWDLACNRSSEGEVIKMRVGTNKDNGWFPFKKGM